MQVRAGNFRAAHTLVDDLRRRIPNVNLAYYVNSDALLSMEKATGASLLPQGEGAAGGQGEDQGVDLTQ